MAVFAGMSPQHQGSVWRHALGLLLLTAGAWGLHVFGREWPTLALIAVWAAMTLLIATGLARRGRIRRAAFLAAYIRAESRIGIWLRGHWLIRARALVLGAALALVLAVALIRLDDPRAWAVLVIAAPVTALTFGFTRRVLRGGVTPGYLPEIAWRITLFTVGGLLFASLVALAFYRPYPELTEISLERAVWHFVDEERARSAEAQLLLQLGAAKDALRVWLAQQLMPQPGASLAQALGWVLVLAEEAVFAWSYLLYFCPMLLGWGRHDETHDAPGP